MISLIIGNKGSGKTKRLINLINEAVAKSDGTVVCIEKSPLLTYEVTHKARLIETERFGIEGCDAFYGMVCGIIAQDHDLTEVFVDATFKIVGRDYDEFAALINKLSTVSEEAKVDFVFTVSEDKEKLPEALFAKAQVI
jgi:ABC-type polysaccharide/polyol phosphate transport system ATPase subunit